MKPRLFVFLPIFLFVASSLRAQSTREAVEPLIPPLCTTVDAQLRLNGNTLAAEDEQKLDTARIQRAIDRCGKGRAVRLRVYQDKDAFLSGPLMLRPEVTLILDRGVTLLAARDAALYARTPGSCGVVNGAAPGCMPLISADKADGAGIMGDGVIDGRGGEKLLGTQTSWWSLAEQAGQGGHPQAPRLIDAERSDNFTLYRITLRNAPAEVAFFERGDGFTVWGVHIDSPQRWTGDRSGIVAGEGAKNVTITRMDIRADNSPVRR